MNASPRIGRVINGLFFLPYDGLPALPAIIDQELATSQRWHELEGGTGRLDDARQRLMRALRDDAPQRVELRAFPYCEYLGLNHWPGAHLATAKEPKAH